MLVVVVLVEGADLLVLSDVEAVVVQVVLMRIVYLRLVI